MKKIILLFCIVISQVVFATPNEDLINYVEKNREDDLIDLLENSSTADVNLNYRDQFGFTAIQYAAYYNRPEMLEILLSSPNSIFVLPNITTADGDTAFSIAIAKCPSCINILLSKYKSSIDLNLGGSAPLVMALTKGDDELASRLIKIGAISKIDMRKSSQVLPMLKFLAFTKFPLTLKEYLSVNNDSNTRFENKLTPLMISSSQNNLENVKILIDSGARINLRDEKDFSALMYSVINYTNQDETDSSATAVYDYLIESGAKTEFVTPTGFTAGQILETRKNFLLSFDNLTSLLSDDSLVVTEPSNVKFKKDSKIAFFYMIEKGTSYINVSASELTSSFYCNDSKSSLEIRLKENYIVKFNDQSDFKNACIYLQNIKKHSNNFYKIQE